MTDGAGSPRDPAAVPNADQQVLHHTERTRVIRLPAPDGRGWLIRKEFLGPDARMRSRNEAMILRRLAGVTGVPEFVAIDENAHFVVMKDPGGEPLTRAPGEPPPDRADVRPLVALAGRLAQTLAQVHHRGVIHRDINPSNVLEVDGRPTLIDFAGATTFADEVTDVSPSRQFSGTLAYLAPEQTGRTGRSVDHRADLYALGATLYELATGSHPFPGCDQDPLALLHAHLAEIPTPPAELNPALPGALSAIISRLLEKEPEQRYQSAEGLAHDLCRLLGLLDEPFTGDPELPLATRDFPRLLTPPSRPVGRDDEIEVLRTAFSTASRDRPRLVLVSGAAGVGKTSLIEELRPTVTAGGGWFVTAKFDQYRRDQVCDGFLQGLRGLSRLLLAEPEEELRSCRERALAALGPNAGLLAHQSPVVATLLGVPPRAPTEGAAQTRARTYQSIVALLGAIASPSRPVVLVLDDLQWATAFSIGAMDAVLDAADLTGVLLVGSYRGAEVDVTHPLSATLSRWEDSSRVAAQLRLTNLSADDLATMVGRMLRLDPSSASPLVQAIGARTGGNPYDTVELINTLRQEGALVPTVDGWRWDLPAISGFIGTRDVVDLLTTRIDRLPEGTRRLLTVLACLGGEVDITTLAAAAGTDPPGMQQPLVPARANGLLVLHRRDGGDGGDADDATVRFRHDRIQEAVLSGQEPAARNDLRLDLARRLARHPEFAGIAAEQYLLVVDEVHDADELVHVARLFLAAAEATRVTNAVAAEHFLSAARQILLRGGADGQDPLTSQDPLTGQVRRAQHAVLCSLGRLADADAVFAEIESHTELLDLAGPVCEQISSLTNRRRPTEAVTLGLDLLRRLGLTCDTPRPQASAEASLDRLRSWLGDPGRAADGHRPELAEPRLVAAAKVISRLMAPAYFSEPQVMSWLVIQAATLWADRGPCADLVGSLSHSVFIAMDTPADRRVTYDVLQHVLDVAQACNYEPATSLARFHFSVILPWFQPVENAVLEARRARDGLLMGGIVQEACFTYNSSAQAFLDCAPDLATLLALLDSGLEFAVGTANRNVTTYLTAYHRLVLALRGETTGQAGEHDPSCDDATSPAGAVDDPIGTAQLRLCGALEAALLGSPAELAERSVTALAALQSDPAGHGNALGRLLRALAVAQELRTGAAGREAELLAELDGCREWLRARSQDAPANYAHLSHLVDAERAWGVGDIKAALNGFEAALADVAAHCRPWHRALINERAGLFHLEHGWEHTAVPLLARARRLYRDWGAAAKVRQLDERYPMTRSAVPEGSPRRSLPNTADLSADTVDLLSVLRASQALSRETNLSRLHAAVVEVVGGMTGASTVRLAVRNEESADWFLPADPAAAATRPGPAADALICIAEAGKRGMLPLTAFRYVERTCEPLLIDDTSRDDRLARDPYFAARPGCSLLVVPILSKTVLRAILLLENRFSRGAFSPDRIDAVKLIAGQLAVCLDNALAERFRALVQRSADVTLVSSRAGVISYASGPALDLLGPIRTPLIGRPIRDLAHPDDAQRLSEYVRLAHPGRSRTLECRLRKSDGSPCWAEVTLTDLTADPAVGGVMLRLRDISERRRLENELRHAQRLESVGQLAAGIAHEINTPVQFIRDNLRFLTDAFAEVRAAVLPAPEVAFFLDEIPQALADSLEGAERVARIVKAMRAFGHRGGEGKGHHDLNQAIRNTIVVATSELRPVADVVEDLADLPPVWCAIGDINQVVLNLVVNAAHAMGRRMAETGERGTLTVRTRSVGSDVVIEVQDTGVGIPPEIADRVFDPFYTTKDVGAGTGQGLTLSYSLVHDHHGGTITFTSRPGMGTTFTVRFPNRPDLPAAPTG